MMIPFILTLCACGTLSTIQSARTAGATCLALGGQLLIKKRRSALTLPLVLQVSSIIAIVFSPAQSPNFRKVVASELK